MKYLELTNLCKKCLYGCNLLGEPFFTGKTECENYIGEETGLEKCWKILKGEQMSYEQISQSKNNSRWNKV